MKTQKDIYDLLSATLSHRVYFQEHPKRQFPATVIRDVEIELNNCLSGDSQTGDFTLEIITLEKTNMADLFATVKLIKSALNNANYTVVNIATYISVEGDDQVFIGTLNISVSAGAL